MKLIYTGKAKELYETENENEILIKFTDNATAGNGLKHDVFKNKGIINVEISNIIYEYLTKNGVRNHLIKTIGVDQICEKCVLIPLEVIVRNKAAGSMAKKMGLENGHSLSKAIFELSYKDDSLGDPFINDDYALSLDIINEEELIFIKNQAFRINELLIELFNKVNIELVDFKIEFGKNNEGVIMLIDEITPDTMRLWEKETNKKLDKDNYRLEVGNLIDAYSDVLERLRCLKA